MKKKLPFVKMASQWTTRKKSIVAQLGGMALKFFDQNWERQGFLNGSLAPWRASRALDRGQLILTKTGRLRRNLKKDIPKGDSVTIRNKTRYAYEHNYGKNGQFQRKFIGKSVTLDMMSYKLIKALTSDFMNNRVVYYKKW